MLITVKHFGQLLADEPLDFIIIHHVSLEKGDDGKGKRQAKFICSPSWEKSTGVQQLVRQPTGAHPSYHLPLSLGVPACQGCRQVLGSLVFLSHQQGHVVPWGPWSHFSLVLRACRLVPFLQDTLSLLESQLHPGIKQVRCRALSSCSLPFPTWTMHLYDSSLHSDLSPRQGEHAPPLRNVAPTLQLSKPNLLLPSDQLVQKVLVSLVGPGRVQKEALIRGRINDHCLLWRFWCQGLNPWRVDTGVKITP